MIFLPDNFYLECRIQSYLLFITHLDIFFMKNYLMDDDENDIIIFKSYFFLVFFFPERHSLHFINKFEILDDLIYIWYSYDIVLGIGKAFMKYFIIALITFIMESVSFIFHQVYGHRSFVFARLVDILNKNAYQETFLFDYKFMIVICECENGSQICFSFWTT